ncbi:hypothetical protein LCGC14_1319070 [marine sediment metagenome]|uniref:Uncharacterized protein n=1 Tax=marine sediment metagenome TaxID=412755 RepID=A0A0F9KK23_9ZZZZ|nr:MAG: hypothetical protein Lokiarch_34720 [Candidatus Lokiarchaeum sp. GC14_75]
MPGKVKHIPENSVSLIIKFQTMEEKSRLIQDEELLLRNNSRNINIQTINIMRV